MNAKTAFNEVIKIWIEWVPEWKELFPDKSFVEELGIMNDLKDLDIKVLLNAALKLNESDKCFGYLLTMCNASKS